MDESPAPPEWQPGPGAPPSPGAAVDLWLAAREAATGGSERALRAVLARYLDTAPERVPIHREAGEKPRLAERPERLRFNLSHSGRLLLVAVAELEVGVDVERIAPRRHDLAIAERRLGATAAAAVRAAEGSDRAAVFTAEWARFEARNKCLGLGAFAAAPAAAAVAVADLAVAPGYAAAVAVRGDRVTVGGRYLLER